MIQYATADDLAQWMNPVPANPERLLRSATLLVALAAGRNPYTDSAPTGAEAEALRDATCAQVATWVGAGIDPSSGAAGEAPTVKRSEIFEGKVEYDTATLAAARAKAVEDLVAQARAILTVAGLLVVPMPLFDECGLLPRWGLDSPVGTYGYRGAELAEWPLL